jgi:hypothetical protein
MTSLVHAFISSHLDYCNSLFYGCPDYLINQLQLVQNGAARVVMRAGKYDSAKTLCRDLHWLAIKLRIQYKLAILSFKIYYEGKPAYFSQVQSKSSIKETRQSKYPTLQSLAKLKTSCRYGDYCYFKSIPAVFNSLPADLRDVDVYNTFKKKLKTYLFTLAY